ncbi:MAG TPA: hypothetical protein VFE65_02485 [Pseudonocardia sp.]|jgi:hypothetical protein|nr:hypothetical protein [Pseudonocardia sp.]
MRARLASSLAVLAALVAAPLVFLAPAQASDLSAAGSVVPARHGSDGDRGRDDRLNHYNGPTGSGPRALHTRPVPGMQFYGATGSRRLCDRLGDKRRNRDLNHGFTCVKRGGYGAYDLYERTPPPPAEPAPSLL